MRLYQFILFLLFITSFANAQDAQTIVDRKRMLIGQNITLTYHVTLKKSDSIYFTPFKLLIPGKILSKNKELTKNKKCEFEVTEKFQDTSIIKQGKIEWFGTYRLTAWDSGYFQIPKMQFRLNGKVLYFPPVSIEVDLVKANEGQDIYDIKESFTKLPDKKFSFKESFKEFNSNYGRWFYPLLLLLIALMFYLWWKAKKKDFSRVQQETVKELSLKDKTLLLINQLDEKQLWKSDLFKEHYVELSFIIRGYLSTRYELNLLEKTSYETKLLLTKKGIDLRFIQTIGEVLEQADMVKFAKSEPEELTVIRISILSKDLIVQTTPEIKENV